MQTFDSDKFKARLRELRGNDRQADIASRLGISLQSYSTFENGREPNYTKLVELAGLHNVSIDYLLGITDHKNPGAATVNELTGLSEEALVFLHTNKPRVSVINRLFESSKFFRLLDEIERYIKTSEAMPYISFRGNMDAFDKIMKAIDDVQDEHSLERINKIREAFGGIQLTEDDFFKKSMSLFEEMIREMRINEQNKRHNIDGVTWSFSPNEALDSN